MNQNIAKYFGYVLVAVGILGFIPGITSGAGYLLGIFQVDTLHNIIHILTGVLAIAAARGAGEYVRLYFQVFGVVYAVVAVAGFFQGDTVLGLIDVNLADNLLHVIIAAFALYLGFGKKGGAGQPAV